MKVLKNVFPHPAPPLKKKKTDIRTANLISCIDSSCLSVFTLCVCVGGVLCFCWALIRFHLLCEMKTLDKNPRKLKPGCVYVCGFVCLLI